MVHGLRKSVQLAALAAVGASCLMVAACDSGGTLTFSLGAPVTLTSPPASKVIDGSAIGL